MALDRDNASCAKCSWAPQAQDTSRSDAVVGRQAQRRQGEALGGGKAA